MNLLARRLLPTRDDGATLRPLHLARRLLSAGSAGAAGSAAGADIASSIAVQVAARATSMAISVVTVSLTVRTLAPAGYGVYNGMAAYVALFGVLTDLGFTTAAMQRMSADPAHESEWLGALAGARGLFSLAATAVCAATIPLLLSNAHHGHLVGWIMAVSILSTAPNALMTVFQSRLRSGLALSFSVLQSFVWLAIVIVLAIVHGSVVAFAAAQVSVIMMIALLQVGVTRRYAQIAWRAGRSRWRPLMKVALPLGISGVLIAVYYQIDSVLLLQLAGPHEAGIYGAAYNFLSPLMFLPAAIMSSFFPVLSAVYASDPDRARRLVQVCGDIMGVIGLPILAVTIALSHQIIGLLYGPGFGRSASLLPILMIAFVSICFGTLAGFLAPLLGLQWRLAIYSGLGALANVALNLVLIPSYGAFGSAWATVATEILTMVLMLGTSLRALRLRPNPSSLIRTLAAA
ncbi:MAG TPA: flippase, partial [Solirubrobacteraceae bacterium]|nr:flippase [Solirubrobacteraceae bacterium]